MNKIQRKKEKSTIPDSSELLSFRQGIEKFIHSDVKFFFTPPFGGTHPNRLPLYGFPDSQIPVPEREGTLTTVDPLYLERVLREQSQKGQWILDNVEVQAIVEYCDNCIELVNKLKRGDISLNPDEPPLAKWIEEAELYKKVIKAISKGLIPKDKRGARKKNPVSPDLKKECKNLTADLEGYLIKKCPSYVKKQEIHGKPYLLITKLDAIKPALKNFPPIRNGSLPNIPDAIDRHFNRKRSRLINTPQDLAIHILAKKYGTTFHRIKRDLAKR